MRVKETDRVRAAIYRAIDETNPLLPAGQAVEKADGFALYGPEGCLDSLGLVNLIVAVEEALQGEFCRPISIADERAFSRQKSPFLTVGTLMEFVGTLVDEPG